MLASFPGEGLVSLNCIVVQTKMAGVNAKHASCYFILITFLSFEGVFNKTIIPLELVGYEMIIANSALRAFLTIYHLVSNAR